MQHVWKNDPRIHLIKHSRYFNTPNESRTRYNQYVEGYLNVESDENIIRKYGQLIGLPESLKKISSSCPNAKILITIREQKSLILSGYKHHVRQTSHRFSLPEWLKNQAGESYLMMADYLSVYDIVTKYFPAENISIVPFEILKRNPADFFELIYRGFLGIPPPKHLSFPKENIGLTDFQVQLKLFSNKSIDFLEKHLIFKLFTSLPPKIIFRLSQALPLPDYVYQDWSNSIDSFLAKRNLDFQSDNQQLSRLIGMDLSEFGYH